MKKYYLLTILSLFIVLPVLAQTSDSVSLISVVSRALDYYPKLKEQKTQLEVADYKTDIIKSKFRPTVEADAVYRHIYPTSYAQLGGGERLAFFPLDQWDMGLKVSQTIYDFGKTNAEFEKTKSEKKLSEDQFMNTSFNFAYQVANVYNNIIFLNKSIDAIDAQINVLTTTLKVIDSRIRNGVGIEFDLVSTQVKLNDAINRKTELLNNLKKQSILLNALSGSNLEPTVQKLKTFEYSMKTFNADSVFAVAQHGNTELLAAKSKQAVAANEVKVNSKNWAPSLVFNGGVGYKNGYFPGNIYNLEFNYVVGAGLSIPIYTGGRNDNQHKISKVNLQASQYYLDEVSINLKKDIEQNIADVNTFQQKVVFSATQMEQARRALDLANSRFKNGVITNIELLDAQSNVLKSSVDKIFYEYQVATTQLELKRLMGVRFWAQN
ncbi:TolC family protein [Solitalea koreensis]|uniref:Outer membrane protein TolC n=1 Tax=Solitalea koreensis TaxID=543615 RepID=A0A521DA71_9SPHI|nr:TolC family protein [Solitalea koreensis]SMO68616.1 Outer membrane protein TolC [Solitalea koreensis]